MRYVIGLLLAVMITGCGSVSGDNVGATLSAGDRKIATEAASVAQAVVAFGTESAGTVEMLSAEYQNLNSINEQIFVTLAAGSTPTVSLLIGTANPPPGTAAQVLQTSQSATITGISDTVNSTTGCVVNARNSFEQQSLEQLYITFVANNLAAGSTLRAEWYRDGVSVAVDDWLLENGGSNACYWFVIDRSDTDFAPGNWTVKVFANGIQLGATASFVISG